jgi:hypothetical protein
MTDGEREGLERIRATVGGFPRPDIDANGPPRTFFIDPAMEPLARRWARTFWLPVERTNQHFLYAYSALFGIPTFVQEAVDRQPDRFSEKRLPLTIRSTASFILDAFGFDRRTGRERNVLYDPGPAIRHVHARGEGKNRISDPAMAYFVAQLLTGAERNQTAEVGHFDYVSAFLRTAGYTFPESRVALTEYILDVDRTLAGDTFRDLWTNIQQTAVSLGVDLDTKDLAEFLPHHTSGHFTRYLSFRGDLP